MILSHSVALKLLAETHRSRSGRPSPKGRGDLPDGKLGQKLERLVALAARLIQMGRRDLPLPVRLRQLDLRSVPPVAEEAVAPVFPGLAAASGRQAVFTPLSRAGLEPVASRLTLPRGGKGASSLASRPISSRLVAAVTSGMQDRSLRSLVTTARPGKRWAEDVPVMWARATTPSRHSGVPSTPLRTSLLASNGSDAADAEARRLPGSGENVGSKAPSGVRALEVARTVTAGRRNAATAFSPPASRGEAFLANKIDGDRKAAAKVMPVIASATAPAVRLGRLTALQAASRLPLDSLADGAARGASGSLAFTHSETPSRRGREPSQDALRRIAVPAPVMPNGRQTGFVGGIVQPGYGGREMGGLSATDPEPGPGETAGRGMMVNLTGDVFVDGRRLGQVAASSQARHAALPLHGPSRVNLRAVPIHSGMQIPQ